MAVRELMYLADKNRRTEGRVLGELEGVDFSESGVSEFHKKKLIKQRRERRASFSMKKYTPSARNFINRVSRANFPP